MRKQLIVTIVLLFSLLLSACSSTAENETGNQNDSKTEQEEQYSDHGGFLWKVENGDTEVYMQGTIHLGNKTIYPLNKDAELAYEDSDVVLPEVDLTEIDIADSQEMIMDYGMYEDGGTIADDINEETLEDLEEILTEAGMELEMVEGFKPWYIETLLLELALQDTNLSSEYSVDGYFLERAKEDGKDIQELESFESQMEVLSGMSEEVQITALEDAVELFDEIGDETEEMFETWKNGDIDGLIDADDDPFEDNAEYKEAMNDDRNMDMANKIDDILVEDSGQTYFVIVGSMHFIAEPSIISILEDKDYEIEHIY